MKKLLPIFLFLLVALASFAQPANDNCSDAIPIAVDEIVTFSTIDATTDGPYHPTATTPCPSSDNDTLWADIWYAFTPTFSGLANWTMCGTADFDSKIAVYNPGSLCPPQDGDLLVCNDDGALCAGSASQITFDVTSGMTYLLRLGGWGATAPGATGQGSFVVEEFIPAISNDFCDQAVPILLGMDQQFSNIGATTDGPDHPNDPGCFGFGDISVMADIWFTFTAPSTTTVEWSTCDQINFDSRMAVYNAGVGCTPVDGDLMACNDDGSGCSNFTSRVIFDVQQGATYLLRLGGYLGEQGSGNFDLFETIPPVPPANDLCVDSDSAWIVTVEMADDFEGGIEGTTINATAVPFPDFVFPNGQCFANTAGGEFASVWYWFNSYGNTELELRMIKGADSETAQFFVDMFETCDMLVDTMAIAGSCLFMDDVTDFAATTVTGLPVDPTIYLIRVTTRLTTDLPGDFFLFIVGDTVTAVNEVYPGQANVFPNPASSILYLNLALDQVADTEIKIFNALGEMVLYQDKGLLQTGLHQFDFDIGNLSSGVYFTVLQSEKGASTFKFIKE